MLNTPFRLLHVIYGLVPIVAGVDKFTNLLTDWSGYLSPAFASFLPVSAQTFMLVVGVIEIVAGLIVFVKPAVGGWIVCLWLIAIAANLLAGGYYDIAVRDLAMAAGAYTLARLAVAARSEAREAKHATLRESRV